MSAEQKNIMGYTLGSTVLIVLDQSLGLKKSQLFAGDAQAWLGRLK